MKYLFNLWGKISNIGIDVNVAYIEQIKIRVLNQAILIALPSQIAITIYFLFTLHLAGILIGFGIMFLLVGLWILNWYQKFDLARVLLNTTFPLFMLAIGVTCGEASGIHYNFMIFIVSGFFFHNRFLIQITLGLYNLILFFTLNYYWTNYSSPYDYIVSPIFNSVSYIVTITSIVVILQRFIIEITRMNTNNELLMNSLEDNNAELKSANQALERVAYVASHDLKTPLRTILGFTELLERDYQNNKTERFPFYFSHVKQGARQMNELIKNTLEYSRANNIEEEKTWINLNEIVANIHTAYVTNKSIEINCSTLPNIFAEENQVLSLFQNLIENGIKYNDKPVKTIEVTHIETPYSLQIMVKDNGIGIPKKFHEQIFTMFKRLHTNQEYEGTGLGLAICEKIVDKMNGKISLTSVEGQGTTFYIDLPR